eukprot:8673-Prorocentrum_minimum.AAC.1
MVGFRRAGAAGVAHRGAGLFGQDGVRARRRRRLPGDARGEGAAGRAQPRRGGDHQRPLQPLLRGALRGSG